MAIIAMDFAYSSRLRFMVCALQVAYYEGECEPVYFSAKVLAVKRAGVGCSGVVSV